MNRSVWKGKPDPIFRLFGAILMLTGTVLGLKALYAYSQQGFRMDVVIIDTTRAGTSFTPAIQLVVIAAVLFLLGTWICLSDVTFRRNPPPSPND